MTGHAKEAKEAKLVVCSCRPFAAELLVAVAGSRSDTTRLCSAGTAWPISSVARSVVHPSARASAASQPSLTASGVETTAMDLASTSAAHLLTPFAYSSPGKSASGQMTTSRPRSGDQSAFSALLLPFGLVTTTKPGIRRLAASVAFSPSQTTTGANG